MGMVRDGLLISDRLTATSMWFDASSGNCRKLGTNAIPRVREGIVSLRLGWAHLSGVPEKLSVCDLSQRFWSVMNDGSDCV